MSDSVGGFQAKLEWHQDEIQFQGTKQNPPFSEIIIIIVIARRGNAMDRNLMIAQILAYRTWQDFNLMTMVDGANTFPSTVFQRQNMQQQRCDRTSLFGTPCSLIVTDNVSQAADCFQ